MEFYQKNKAEELYLSNMEYFLCVEFEVDTQLSAYKNVADQAFKHICA